MWKKNLRRLKLASIQGVNPADRTHEEYELYLEQKIGIYEEKMGQRIQVQKVLNECNKEMPVL